jgi:hypothetical protein
MKLVVKSYLVMLICLFIGHTIGSFIMQDYSMTNLKWFLYSISTVAIAEQSIREQIFKKNE